MSGIVVFRAGGRGGPGRPGGDDRGACAWVCGDGRGAGCGGVSASGSGGCHGRTGRCHRSPIRRRNRCRSHRSRARRLTVHRAGARARHARPRVLRQGGGRTARRTRRGRCGPARRGGTRGEPARRGRAAGDGRPGRVPDGNPAVRAGAHGRPAPAAGARGRPRRPGDADARRAPGARRGPDGAVPHRGKRLPGDGPEPWLSYADLAVAKVDEIERPVRRRTRVSVSNFRYEKR